MSYKMMSKYFGKNTMNSMSRQKWNGLAHPSLINLKNPHTCLKKKKN